jgi:carbon storage regulator
MDAAVRDESGGSTMLVLSRKYQESVVGGADDGLGDTVKVVVLGIVHGSVRLGLGAGKDVPVHREEVWERIRASGQRDPPTGGPDRTESSSAIGKTCVLSGMGKGRSPKSMRDRV